MNSIVNVLRLLAVVFITTANSAPNVSTTRKPLKDISLGTEKTEVTLQQAINIVEKRHLTDCVARTICEISCNPEIYGQRGQAVYQTLKKFESDTLPKLAFYKNARDKGQALNQTNCSDCTKLYTNCKTSTETLLRLGSALTIKS